MISYTRLTSIFILGFATAWVPMMSHGFPAAPAPLVVPSRVSGKLFASRLEKFVDRLFDGADTNHDGKVSMEESYTLVLKMYIRVNQQAPIPPPTKETVQALFKRADQNRSGSLDRTEFTRLMLVLHSRATVRLILVKFSQVFVAPLLAFHCVQWMAGSKWLVTHLAPQIPSKYADLLLNRNLWTTVFTVLFVSTLGNIVLSIANYILDFKYLIKDQQDKSF
eukprot:scaffold49887_cov48-Attheya_sp.AAC.3